MKRILFATAVAAMAATPALAQSMWTSQPATGPDYPYQNSWTNTYGSDARVGATVRPYGYGMSGPYAMAPGYSSGAFSGPYAYGGVYNGLAPSPINPNGGPGSSSMYQ